MLYKKLVLILILILTTTLFSHNFILENEDIIGEKANNQIELIGKEFYKKTSVSIYLVAVKKLDGKKVTTYIQDYASKLQPPFVLLLLSKEDKKIDILINSKETLSLDKDYILDDIIIPILITKSKKNSTISTNSAALLSGYSEIAEQIAESKNIELVNAIGNDSKNFIYWFRVFIYMTMISVLIYHLYHRRKNSAQ